MNEQHPRDNAEGFHIEMPAAAMDFVTALNRVMRLFGEAVENNDPVLAGVCMAQIAGWLDVETEVSAALARTIFCGGTMSAVGDRILEEAAKPDHPVNVVERELYERMAVHFDEMVDELADQMVDRVISRVINGEVQ
jgi:hypothetical protein